MPDNKKNILFDIFITFAKIGLFTFGGGYAMLPFMQQEVLTNNWMNTQPAITRLYLTYYILAKIYFQPLDNSSLRKSTLFTEPSDQQTKTGLGDPARGSAASAVPLEVCDTNTELSHMTIRQFRQTLLGIFVGFFYLDKLTTKQITL